MYTAVYIYIYLFIYVAEFCNGAKYVFSTSISGCERIVGERHLTLSYIFSSFFFGRFAAILCLHSNGNLSTTAAHSMEINNYTYCDIFDSS